MDKKQWAEWNFEQRTGDGQFLDGPGWISKLIVSANATGATSVVFYDGHTTSGKLKLTMHVPTSGTRSVNFSIPIKVEQGLYADASANIACVAVQYLKVKP